MVPSISPANPADASAMAELISGASERSFLREFGESGRLRFLSDHTSEAMIARLQSGDFNYYLAEVNGLLVGVVGVRASVRRVALGLGGKASINGRCSSLASRTTVMPIRREWPNGGVSGSGPGNRRRGICVGAQERGLSEGEPGLRP
jgi:hypothetical protein